MDRRRTKKYDKAYFDRWYRRHGIGCGEGAWRAPLLAAQPGLRYVGFDPSTYAVERYGRTRSIRLDGLAYLHAMTATDDFSGDRVGFHRRSANRYVQLFAAHGLRRVGPHLYAGPAVLATLTALEGPLEDPVDDTDVQ